MASPAITLTATLQSDLGVDIANSKLRITLIGFGDEVPRVVGTAMIAKTGPIYLSSANGSFSTPIWGNDVIFPADTYYEISVIDDKGNVPQSGLYQLSGSGSQDLSTLTQYVPQPPPPPPVPTTDIYVVVTSSAAPSFVPTISAVVTYDFTLTQNAVTQAATGFAQGTLVTFLIRQDATGGWTFMWPGNMTNQPALNPAAGSVTTIPTVVDRFGKFLPLSGGVWN